MKIFLTLLVILLLGTLGYGSWMYVQQTEQLLQTEATLAGLNDNLISLQSQLVMEQESAANIQSQLVTEKAHATTLENELTLSRSQVSSTENQKKTLQSDLDASKTQISTLQVQLDAANAQISGTQTELLAQLNKVNTQLTKVSADLAKANTDLSGLTKTNDEQSAELNKIKDPRHFYTIEELRAWLQRDDTNNNPAYASLGLAEKAFVLQVKALRDGYLLPAAVDADTQHIYSWNVAVIGVGIYVVTASNDETMFLANFEVPPAQRPLPLS